MISGSTAHRQARTVVMGFAGLYSVAALTAHLTRRTPQRSPLMRIIPRRRYYLLEAVFEPPVTVAWMTLFAAVVRGGARRLGGEGSRQSDFDVLAVAHIPPLVVAMWLPDMVCYLSGIDERRYHRLVAVYAPIATVWALAACTLGISEVERISWPRAALLVLLADGTSSLLTGIPLVMR